GGRRRAGARRGPRRPGRGWGAGDGRGGRGRGQACVRGGGAFAWGAPWRRGRPGVWTVVWPGRPRRGPGRGPAGGVGCRGGGGRCPGGAGRCRGGAGRAGRGSAATPPGRRGVRTPARTP